MRIVNMANLLSTEHDEFKFDGVFFDVMGTPARGGIWIIYGDEKNGKTWFALLLAKYFGDYLGEIVLYVSGEEGTGKGFTASLKRAGYQRGTNVKFTGYSPLSEIRAYLRKRGSAKIVFLDNATVYADELTQAELQKLKRDFPNVLFILIAHEKKKEPYLAVAVLAKKLAEIIVRVVGLRADISGRCEGGSLYVDEQKASLYHGTN